MEQRFGFGVFLTQLGFCSQTGLKLPSRAHCLSSQIAGSLGLISSIAQFTSNMLQVTVLCCLAVVVLVTTCECQELGQRTNPSTPLPMHRERLSYTPVQNGIRRERLPYTPVKTTTLRPVQLCTIYHYYFIRPTTRRPFPTKYPINKLMMTPKPCNCNCSLYAYRPICASDGKDTDTFCNRCQLECYNCTLDKHYKVIKKGECEDQINAVDV